MTINAKTVLSQALLNFYSQKSRKIFKCFPCGKQYKIEIRFIEHTMKCAYYSAIKRQNIDDKPKNIH